jgi:hypothetical protein
MFILPIAGCDNVPGRQVFAFPPGADRLLESLVEVLTVLEERLGRPARKHVPKSARDAMK